MNEHAEQPVRPAATVIIARESPGQSQYEIFMLRRTNQAVFAGGMYVFPGGRVDEADHSRSFDGHLRGPSQDQAGQLNSLGDDWQAYWVAGIRETFEEAGILLAYQSDGRLLEYPDEATWQKFHDYRAELHSGGISLAQICARENLTLAIDLMHFYNRWITPLGRPRRFDTRFFIAQAPAAQTGLHDGTETVDSLWISPEQALARYRENDFGLMAVTEKQLSTFAQFNSAAEFVAMARTNQEFPTYRPTIPPGDRLP